MKNKQIIQVLFWKSNKCYIVYDFTMMNEVRCSNVIKTIKYEKFHCVYHICFSLSVCGDRKL